MSPYLIAALIIVVLFAGAIFAATRGELNNNPGNIRDVPGQQWQGQVPCEDIGRAGEGEFACFLSPDKGFRAVVRLLLVYNKVHGLDTVRGIISRWSPPSENDTEEYILYVSTRLMVHPEDSLRMSSSFVLTELALAIVYHESRIILDWVNAKAITQYTMWEFGHDIR